MLSVPTSRVWTINKGLRIIGAPRGEYKQFVLGAIVGVILTIAMYALLGMNPLTACPGNNRGSC